MVRDFTQATKERLSEQIDDIEIFETLNYLEEMGYDLKGFGFLTDYATEEDLADLDDKTNAKIDKELGVIFNTEDEKIVFAESDFIFTYLVSCISLSVVFLLKKFSSSSTLYD